MERNLEGLSAELGCTEYKLVAFIFTHSKFLESEGSTKYFVIIVNDTEVGFYLINPEIFRIGFHQRQIFEDALTKWDESAFQLAPEILSELVIPAEKQSDEG